MSEPLHCEDFGCPPSEACEEPPIVCPGCHAVGEERCAPGCIDAELEADHRHAIESGDYDDWDWDDVNGSADWEYAP